MDGLIETDKMQLHRESCLVCRAADGDIQKYCEAWCEMYENFIDWQSGEGPWEGHEGWRMCDNCDGAVDPAMGLCPACGYMWCAYDTQERSSSDCEEVELCGEPAVGGHPYCKEHQ